jgi:hypothetical protein
VSSSSVSAPTCLRSCLSTLLFFDLVALVPFFEGERLRTLCADWSLSLSSDKCLSSSLKPVFVALGVAAGVDLVDERVIAILDKQVWSSVALRSGLKIRYSRSEHAGGTSEQRCSCASDSFLLVYYYMEYLNTMIRVTMPCHHLAQFPPFETINAMEILPKKCEST